MMNKIDFVIIWVDGNDPAWQVEKQKYQPSGKVDVRNIRYTDWDNLQYWFRGVETFAPWVNKIHFVTWGHLPKWLNTNHEKLHIVKHSDYIPSQYLPTFNSIPIEINLHRIDGLSEQFVYFNDDTFLIDHVAPSDFFIEGKPVESLILNAITPLSQTINSTSFRNTEIINAHFSKSELKKSSKKYFYSMKYGKMMIRNLLLSPWAQYTGFFDFHVASSFTKSLLQEVWDAEFEVLDSASSHRFRTFTDINQWLFRYWSLAKGEFIPRSTKFGKCYNITDHNDALYAAIKQQKYKMICANDTGLYSDFDQQKNQLNQVFEYLLPNKSSYEQ